jgi:ABC-type nitrate/sulfonate/bicarbonate transport system ATPase subunit
MIQIKSLTFGYSGHSPIFQSFNWTLNRGETWAIIGSSGCGKTSLLYLLAGLLKPTSGEILIEGESIVRPRPGTGLILQEYGLLPWSTVKQNAELGLRVHNFYGPDGRHAPQGGRTSMDIMPWLERLGIAHLAEKYPSQISGGQRQRTAIARTLALRPDVLLMDEPFSSLDAVIREDLQALTLELCHEQNITLVMVTHTIEEAAMMGKKILLLGAPPNTKPKVFENPNSGHAEFRQTTEYLETCKTLRKELGNETS